MDVRVDQVVEMPCSLDTDIFAYASQLVVDGNLLEAPRTMKVHLSGDALIYSKADYHEQCDG